MPGSRYSEPTFPEIVVHGLGKESRPVLRLTLLLHPEMHRVGEYAELDILCGEDFALSRAQPAFRPCREERAAAPLNDSYISRQDVALTWWRDQLLLRVPARGNSVLLDGESLVDSRAVNESRLRAGVVLTLAHRVLLFLQLVPPLSVEPETCAMIGESQSMQHLRRQLLQLAPSDAPVLLLGESGTGKELVSRAIHRHSLRAGSPLVVINMAAIPTELAVAELFGARRGAYTGADRDRQGYFQQANGGTLFMDEIGAATPEVQTQLLRVLESGEMQLAGGGVQSADVRVISATDAAIDRRDGQGFSTALRHRLGALELRLPALRERRDDLGRLLLHYLQHYSEEQGMPSLVVDTLAQPEQLARWTVVLAAMMDYPWPGNIRELRNFARQVVLASAGYSCLMIPDDALLMWSAEDYEVRESDCKPRVASRLSDEEVLAAMQAAHYEVAGAARQLDVSRPALYRRIESVPGLRLASQFSAQELQQAHRDYQGDIERAATELRVSRSGLQRSWRALGLC